MVRKKTLKVSPKKMIVAAPEKVRLAIECSPEERKYIKMFAAHEEMTVNDFVLECVRKRITPHCSKSHVPNKKTAAALDATDRGEGLIHFKTIDDFFDSLRK